MTQTFASLFGRTHPEEIAERSMPVRRGAAASNANPAPTRPATKAGSHAVRLAAGAANFAAMVNGGTASFSPPVAGAAARDSRTAAQQFAARSAEVMAKLRATPDRIMAHLGAATPAPRDLTPMAPRQAVALSELVAAKLRQAPRSEIDALAAKVAVAKRGGV